MMTLGKFRTVAIGLLLIGGIVPGCAKSGRAVVTIQGTVSYKGQKVTDGAIYLHAPDHQVAMGKIFDDGTFTATEVPVGEVRVSFQFRPGDSGGMYGGGKKPEGVTSLPEKFNNPNTSGLTYTINRDTKTLDVKIE